MRRASLASLTLYVAVALVLGLTAAAPQAWATSYTWNGGAGAWTTDETWTVGLTVPR